MMRSSSPSSSSSFPSFGLNTSQPSPIIYRALIASNILMLCMIIYGSFFLLQHECPQHVTLNAATSHVPSQMQLELHSNTPSEPHTCPAAPVCPTINKEVIVVNDLGSHRWGPTADDVLLSEAEYKCLTMHPTPTIHSIGKKWGTDKVTSHRYDSMYDVWLSPYRCKPVKILEVGLGCDMSYGPGKSYHTWLEYFPFVDLHYLELNGDCVDVKRDELSHATIHVGDQGDVNVLKKLLRDSKGGFDIIIDDGSHIIRHQLLSIEWLYRFGVKPGGLFFMEDLHTSGPAARWAREGIAQKDPNTVEVMTAYARNLMFFETEKTIRGLEWTKQIACGAGMCVMQKYTMEDLDREHYASTFFYHPKPKFPNTTELEVSRGDLEKLLKQMQQQ